MARKDNTFYFDGLVGDNAGYVADKIEVKEEISDSQKFKNIFSNAGLTLQNAWKSTQISAYEFANYLGIGGDTYVDNFIEGKYAEIAENQLKYKDTGEGIAGGDIALGITEALVGVVTTVVPAIATRGISLVPQIMAPMYTEYNLEKAKRMYGAEDIEESIKKLRDNGELELATPLALGATAVILERVGIKGIKTHVLKNARTPAAKQISSLMITGSKEGITEYIQGGLEVANIALAKNEKNVGGKVFDHLGSKAGLESFLQGFVGGAGISAAGAAINNAFRDDKDALIVQQYVDKLGALQQQKVNSKTKKAKDAVDKEIQKTEKEFKDYLINTQNRSEYVTEQETQDLLKSIEKKEKLNKEKNDFEKQVANGELSQSEFDIISKDIDTQLQNENQKIADIKIEANKRFLMDDVRISEEAVNKISGLEQKAYKTKQEFLDAYNAKTGKNKTLKDIEGVDGLVVDSEIMINVETAAENNAVTVGSHELLHSIVKSSITGKIRNVKDVNGNTVETDLTEEGATLIKDFLNTLSKKERSVVQKRIDDNYRYKRDKDGNIISEKAFEQYAEEYLNAYADAAIKNELTDSVLVKIGKFLSKIFNKGDRGYKNLEFKTGEDVKAFLKAYVSDRKKGKFRQQFVKMAQEGAKQEPTIEKKSLSAAARQQISDSVKEIGSTYSFEGGKKAWKEGGADNAIQEIRSNNYLDDLIAAKFKGDKVPVDFVDKVYAELTNHIRNFNPETNDNLFGWINSQLANKAGNVFNREYKTTVEQRTAKDVDDRTKEGEVKVQVAAEEDARTKAFEEEDISPQAEARRKAQAAKKKEDKKSELRQAIGIKDDSDAYNAVLETARKVLIRAYDAGKTARQIQRDLTKEASTYLFKQVKNMLGTKRNYIGNITKFRVPLVNSMFTSDLVQLERNVPDNEKVFTRFIKNLTSKQEVQDAVDNNLLQPSALNTIDKGQSVALYEKVMPTEKQFIDFFDQPLINPKTGARSGLRGTRKDQLAKYVAASLNYDATMQVAQEPEVIEKRKQIAEIKNQEIITDDIQQLSTVINRDPNIKFHYTNTKNFSKKQKNQIKLGNKIILDLDKAIEINDIILKDGSKIIELQNLSEKQAEKYGGKFLINTVIDAFDSRGIERVDNIDIKKIIQKSILTPTGKIKKGAKFSTAYEQFFISLANAAVQKLGADLDVNLVVREGGFPDVAFQQGGVIIGLEIKMDQSRGVSYTYKFDDTISNENSQNQTEQENLIKQIKSEIAGLSGITIEDLKRGVTPEQYMTLRVNKSIFNKYVIVDAAYLEEHYTGKLKPEYFINIGDAGLFYMLGKEGKEGDPNNGLVEKIAQELGIPRLKGKFQLNSVMNLGRKPRKTMNNTHAVTIRVQPRIDTKDVANFPENSNLNLSNKADMELFVNTVNNKLNSFSLEKLSKSVSNVNTVLKYSKTSKGMSAFDFDETLIDKGKNFIIATSPDGDQVQISSAQWPVQGPQFAEQGYTFDFKDFVNVRGGVEGPLLQKLRNRIKKYGAKNNYILTARPAESATAIHGWLKTKGINIPLENITGLGNSTGEAKARWIAGKYAEGYNDIYFVDDALPNVKAVADIINKLDIKGKAVQAKLNFSNEISNKFNDIIEESTGVESQKRFSEVQANLRGRKSKYFSLVPPSAQDFVGLLYNFLGKGRTGEQQFKFFKKTLIDPFARGINELNTARQSTMEKYMELLKGLPKVKKQLNTELKKFKDVPSYVQKYTVDQAVRVYLWNKQGFEVPGMTQRDLDALTEFVKNNPDIQSFADVVGSISQEQQSFSEPGEYWLTENIKSDLFSDGALGDARSKYLAEWQENVDQMFSPENMNKIKAIYGAKFTEALRDMLYRMKTGRNRPTNRSRLTNAWMNWVNGSVGAIMFFNIRSAVLQTISSINYINWSDNNPLKAAAAFANQTQYWKDFSFLFNSDMLKQRRAGNQRGVNEQELSEAVAGKGAFEQAKAAIRYLLKIGFLPTQIADSFAISAGGATFYRNRINKYVKDGMTQKQAEKQAFIDFQEITEVSQQSARPDLISQQQADPLGRLILSFQNTPMQYGRIMNKAFRDLVNGRGDSKTHVSKIAYYGVIQGILFTALQSALFATWGDEDDEEKNKKKQRMLNGIVDSWLSTFGYGGKAVSTVKNTMVEYQKQRAKDFDDKFFTKPDHTYTILTALSFSPPIGSKLRKIYSSIQTEKYNRDIMKERGFKVDNPAFSAIGNVIEAVTNIPLGRLSNKLLNLDNALDSRNETWQRVALLLGWNTWDLGIKDQDIEALGENIKERKKQEKKIEKIKNKYPDKSQEEINVLVIEQQVFDLNKREQERILTQNGLNAKNYKLEKDRVDAIMKLRNKNPEKIDKQISDVENYKPSKSEQREIDLFKMNKSEQVNLLINLGLSPSEIKKLKYEEDRVKKIIQLENKSKNR